MNFILADINLLEGMTKAAVLPAPSLCVDSLPSLYEIETNLQDPCKADSSYKERSPVYFARAIGNLGLILLGWDTVFRTRHRSSSWLGNISNSRHLVAVISSVCGRMSLGGG